MLLSAQQPPEPELFRVDLGFTVATVVVISIVKSSLALSLGLVGALSIVRFRSAIKEPEELAYLFLSIGIGLGLGAGQRVVTAGVHKLVPGQPVRIAEGK